MVQQSMQDRGKEYDQRGIKNQRAYHRKYDGEQFSIRSAKRPFQTQSCRDHHGIKITIQPDLFLKKMKTNSSQADTCRQECRG